MLHQMCLQLSKEKQNGASNWCKNLDTTTSREDIQNVFRSIPIKDAQVLAEVFGSIHNLRTVNVNSLLRRTPLSAADAAKVARFLLD